MKHLCRMLLLILAITVAACTETNAWNDSLEDWLHSQPALFGTVMQNPERHRVQIIYTQIDRDANNKPSFRSFSYRLNANEYFYPASTVKLPTALLALEKLNRLGVAGLDKDSVMLTSAIRDSQSPVLADTSASDGLPSVAHYIRKILLVSDNDAFNRMYEFLGQGPLNEAMQAKGFAHTRIMHRLEIALSVEENRHTNPIRFVSGEAVLYEQEPQFSEASYVGAAPILLGEAEVVGGTLQSGPKDFSAKNEFSLQDLHDVVQVLMFPNAFEPRRRFNLSAEDYQFVYNNMSTYPGASGIDAYDNPDEFPDGYVKFLMFGGEGNQLPPKIRIFNKVGDAYGFLTDAAYIVDLENKIEFILAATIYTNANGTFNDDHYEYAEIGMPFLRDLGNAIYALELGRERAFAPDFSGQIEDFRGLEDRAHE